MRRSPTTRIARCLMAAMALLCILAPGTSMAAEKGLSLDLTWGIKSTDQDRTANLLPDVGAKWVRLTFEWNQLETSQGTYNSSKLAAWDRSVALSRQAGTKVLVTVYGTPSWASSNGKVGGAPSNNAYYANLMTFLANRYRGQVQAWEVWNEENVSRFWTTGPDPARYAGLLRAAYPAVKSADPNATVVFGGTSGEPRPTTNGANQLQNRFVAMFSRRMTARDRQAWAAARMIGEAASRRHTGRSEGDAGLLQEPGFRAGRLQGPKADPARLESPAAPADPARRRPRDRLGLAAGRLPASGLGTRYARLRPAGNQMPAQMNVERRRCGVAAARPRRCRCSPPGRLSAYIAYVSNEKSNTVSVIDTDKLEVVRTIKVGQRPRGIAFTKDQKYVLVASATTTRSR